MLDIDELVPGNCSVRPAARVPCKTKRKDKKDVTLKATVASPPADKTACMPASDSAGEWKMLAKSNALEPSVSYTKLL